MEDITCSFCGKAKSQVKVLIEVKGSSVKICDECVSQANNVMRDSEEKVIDLFPKQYA